MLRLGIGLVVALGVGCAEAPSLDPVADPGGGGKSDIVVDPTAGLDSREFKVMLEPSLFSGDLDATLEDLWDDLEEAVDVTTGLELDDPFEPGGQRRIRFFDVPGSCALRSAGYSFRERIEEDEVRELTLKFRSQERWLAELYATEAEGAEYKLEQDLTADKSIFSTSTTIETELDIATLSHAESVFQGLWVPSKSNQLYVVSGLRVHEDKYDGPDVDLGAKKAKFEVSIWYRDEDQSEPWLVELSFKYKMDEDLDAEAHHDAESMFDGLLGLDDWRADGGATKTASVYADAEFCWD